MFLIFIHAIPEHTLTIENLLNNKCNYHDPKLDEILMCCHLLEKDGLAELPLEDHEKEWIKKLGKPNVIKSALALRGAKPTDFEKEILTAQNVFANGERLAFKSQGRDYCLEPDWETIKKAAKFTLFLTRDNEFIVVFNSVPRNRLRYAEHIDKKRKSIPGMKDIHFRFEAIEVDKWAPGRCPFFGKYYEFIPSKDRIAYYQSPIRIGYSNDGPMFSVRSEVAEFAMKHNIKKIRLTLAGFGIGAGRAEIAALSDKSFCLDWDIDVYAFNSPDVFVGQKGIDEFIKIVGAENYHPIQAHIPNAPVVKETFSETWFRECGFKKPAPHYAITVPDLHCRWATKLQYRRTMPWHRFASFLCPV